MLGMKYIDGMLPHFFGPYEKSPFGSSRNLSRKRNDPDDPNLTSSSSYRNRLHVELSPTRIRDPVPHESLPFRRQPYFAPLAGERCLDQWMRAVDVPANRRNMEMNGATTTRAEAVNDGNRGGWVWTGEGGRI